MEVVPRGLSAKAGSCANRYGVTTRSPIWEGAKAPRHSSNSERRSDARTGERRLMAPARKPGGARR